MATVTVSTRSALIAALKSAAGGDTIVLADGDYGAVLLDSKYLKTLGLYDSEVRVVAANPGAARLESLDLRFARNIGFEGIAVSGEVRSLYASGGLALRDSTAASLSFRETDGLELQGNTVTGGRFGITLFSVRNFAVTGNTVQDATEDAIHITRDSHHGLIENNRILDIVAATRETHPDLIQIYGYAGLTPHDIAIRGNHLYDDPATGPVAAQGIFIARPEATGFFNLAIEQNLISVRHINTIYIAGGRANVTVSDNTLLAWTGGMMPGGVLRLAHDAEGHGNAGVSAGGNLVWGLVDETRDSALDGNLAYGNTAAVFAGDGGEWQDFVPLRPEHAGHGARDRLTELDEALPRLAYALPAPLHLSGNLVVTPAHQSRFDQIARVAHSDALEFGGGTVAVTFDADVLGWRRGILSKDSLGTQNGLSVWFQDNILRVKFEDAEGAALLNVAGLAAHRAYDLHLSFGDGRGRAWIDGALAGEVATDMDWRRNDEALVIGADNAQSRAGTTDALRYAFDGTLSDLAVYSRSMSPAELAAWHESHLLL